MAGQNSFNVECQLRFGHCDGHTDLTYDDTGKYILTCGVDSEVRRWPVDNEDEDPQSFSVDEPATAIVCNDKKFFIASEDNAVKSYSVEEGDFDSVTCRFTAAATHIDISRDGKLLVAGAGDFIIKCMDLENTSQKQIEGHEAPILSLAIDPSNELVASSSCDGSVRIWNINQQICIHQWNNNHPKSNDFSNSTTLCRISWFVRDDLIAVPKINEVNLFKKESWELHKTFKYNEFTDISITCFSWDGNFLAASNTKGTIVIWDLNNGEPISVFYHKDCINITSLKWHPKDSTQLAFCDANGQFGLVKIKYNKEIVSEEDFNKENVISNEEYQNMFGDLSDDEEFFREAEIETEPKKSEHFVELPKVSLKQNLNQNKDKKKVEKNEKSQQQTTTEIVFDDDDDENVFDIGKLKSQYEPQIFGVDEDEKEEKQSEAPTSRPPSAFERPPPLELIRETLSQQLQQPFQPGSTPIFLKQRFMVWNSIGIVFGYNTAEEQSIDVEFHDTAVHHSIHIPNVHRYKIADLSAEALILATNHDEDEDSTPSKLFCMMLSTWDATKEWQIEMPNNEQILAVTVGSGFVAAATDKRFVRILTIGGVQTHIFSIPGPVVCLASHESHLMVIYHNACGLPKEQSLSMLLLNIDHKVNRIKQSSPNPFPVSLSPESKVYWAGFTDEGTPCIVDSYSVVRLFKDMIGNTWIPVFTKDENKRLLNYFVIGLSEVQNQVRCIVCKSSRFPDVLPRPTVIVLPLQVPVCEIYTTKGKSEEECLRSKMLASLLKKLSKEGFDVDANLEATEQKEVESLIKLFAISLMAQRESLALEIGYLMPNHQAVQGAISFASKKRFNSLALKLHEVAQNKEQEELKELNENNQDDDDEQLNQIPGRDSLIGRSDEGFQLKPKSMNKSDLDENSNSRFAEDYSEDEMEVTELRKAESEDGSDDEALKPKSVQVATKKGNPFKVVNKKNSKRKNEDDSEESEDDTENTGFSLFYEERKDQILEDNSDVEDEGTLKKIAKKEYERLNDKEKKKWIDRSVRGKRKPKQESRKKSKPEMPSIAGFFVKN